VLSGAWIRRPLLSYAFAFWFILAIARVLIPAGGGLRGQYFRDPRLAGTPSEVVVDPRISTARIYDRWHAQPPAAFSVQWSGYIHAERSGLFTFWTTSDDGSRLYVDGHLVVQNDGAHLPQTATGAIELDEGPHDILLQYIQEGGAYSLEWAWAFGDGAQTAIPEIVLSTRPQRLSIVAARWLERSIWILGVLCLMLASRLWVERSHWTLRRWVRVGALAALAIALATFYLIAAGEHARVMNLSKARGDQTGYLADAEQIYANWHGRTPHALIGERNRMPLYAGFLALFYDPKLSDDEYFVVARTWNIRLSLALLALLAGAFAWYLPPLVAANLTLITTFGVFIFKAGYAQSELLFYTLFFATFVVLLRLVEMRRSLWLATAGGALAALTYLTKAAVAPLVGIFVVVVCARSLLEFLGFTHSGARDVRALLRTLASLVALLAAFLVVLAPYLVQNKRTFGRYFYNVNTTFYIWYDSWPEASVGTILHGDGVGWPAMPDDDIPSMQKYWRTHSLGDIVRRTAGGLGDMVVRSFNTFWYFKYAALYIGLAIMIALTKRSAVLNAVRSRPATAVFVAAYAVVYLLATAFYEPISGTGTTRFLLAHLIPLLFLLSCFFAEPGIARSRWTFRGITIGMPHVHLFIAVTLALDIVFVVWPRLMTTYGGF
jgi:PA14 domain